MGHSDPYASYLAQARGYFEAGEALKAGQIWQAILKKDPAHAEAKAGLYDVRLWLEAQQAPAAPLAPGPASTPVLVVPALEPEPPPTPDPVPEADPFAALPPLPETTQAPASEPDPELPQLHSINLESHVPEAAVKAIKRTQRSVGGQPPEPSPEAPTETEDPPPAPSVLIPDDEDVDRYIREGCTLYDMGEINAAIGKWEAVLLRHPGHAMVLDYLNGARKDLGLAPLPVSSDWSGAPVAVARPTREDADRLLKEAIQLEEMGLPEEALEKLRRVLEVDPDHADAKSYLAMYARTQAGASMVAPPPSPPPASAPPPKAPAEPEPQDFADFTPSTLPPIPPETPPAALPPPATTAPLPTSPSASAPGMKRMDAAALDQKLRQGERLLSIRHHEEAIFAFQMVLMQEPDNPRARVGIEQARNAMAALPEAAPPPPITAPSSPPRPAAPPRSSQAPAPVKPPAAVTAAAPTLRAGPEVATLIKDRAWWKRNPLILGTAAGFLLGSLLALWQSRQKDARLQAAIQAARDAAATPRSSGTKTLDLTESVASIRTEGEAILQEDPVRAYHRALHLLRLNPSDAAGAQLLERAKNAMATPPPATPAELQNHIKAGDLESAAQTATKLLQATPEDAVLIGRTIRLNAALAQSHAARENWTQAREALRHCRDLAPQDPGWQARLKLLDALQTMPKAERAAWIAMLG